MDLNNILTLSYPPFFQEPLSNDIHSRMEAIEEIMDNLHIDTPGCQVTYYMITAKEGGLYYMGGTYIFFLHPKWSKLCTAPLMGPKNPPIKKKVFFARFTLFLGVRKYFFFVQNEANFAQPLL